jgi:hypothetical protein
MNDRLEIDKFFEIARNKFPMWLREIDYIAARLAQQPAAAVPDMAAFDAALTKLKASCRRVQRIGAEGFRNKSDCEKFDAVKAGLDTDTENLCTLYAQALAQRVVPEGIVGEVVEIGDDESGQPRLVIHTTADEIRSHAANILFKRVTVAAAPSPEVKS